MAVLWKCCVLGRIEVQVRAGTGTNGQNGYGCQYHLHSRRRTS